MARSEIDTAKSHPAEGPSTGDGRGDNVSDIAEARQQKNARESKQAVKKPKNRRFNKEKVDRIKTEIADGKYEMDPFRVADKFIEHERK